MKIEAIDTIQIHTTRYYGHVSGHVLVKIHAGGLIGLGEASDVKANDLEAVTAQYRELLVGADATRITEINDQLRAHNFKSNVSNAHLASAIDIGLLDLAGKARGVPVYDLFGGKMRDGMYCCYPIFGKQVRDDFETAAGYLQRLVDLGHHLFRYYVSSDPDLDDRFLTEMKARFGDQIRLKSIDFSGRFADWQQAVRYADRLRHHEPFHFEQPSGSPYNNLHARRQKPENNMRVSAEFTRRVDLPVTMHTYTLFQAMEAIHAGACTAFNLTCVAGGPTHIRRIFSVAEAAGIKCLIGTDQESTLGTAAQVHLGVSVPNLELPCDPMGPVLYNESPAVERVRAEASHLYPSDGPGLGIELDDERLASLTVAEFMS